MTPHESESGVFVSTRQIYDVLLEVQKDLHVHLAATEIDRTKMDDLERRMRVLEKAKNSVMAVAGFVAAVVALVGNLIPIPGK